ncbi:MAG: hypothetical protein HYZ28_01745 [Myxococcales bacterium]|nr:hypothetical protein [Myxococcales bacterium]
MPTHLKLMAAACSALMLGSCVPNESPIRIMAAHGLKPSALSSSTCEAEQANQYRGSMDISGTGAYRVEFDIVNELQPLSTSVGQEQLAGPDRNTFYAQRLIRSYTTSPSIGLEREELAIHIPFQPSESAHHTRIDLISAKAESRLASVVNTTNFVEVIARVQLAGVLAHGQPFTSNEIGYPILVYSSGFQGCSPETAPRARNGPCGNVGGQDDTSPRCCMIPNPKPEWIAITLQDGGTADGGFKDARPDGGVPFIQDPALAEFCPGTAG